MIQRERDNLKEIIPNLPTSIAHAMVAFIICGIMAFLVVIIVGCVYVIGLVRTSKESVVSFPSSNPTDTTLRARMRLCFWQGT